ncbi:decaprenyl-diphosphate synthase subunit 1 [Cimex lectularius]|uniref:All trans-polyprenyl-diphosphate synthase PDSS1 n=1 Tax=Cimex lectularius TaxID=79782 RepID=A0A8I6TCY1_CIMLE|nr:decaprenyl-diphosphate synthase subunit 1 [Cimex lectularius]
MLGDWSLSQRRVAASTTMACFASSRLCARALDKLCQIGRTTQARRKSSSSIIKLRQAQPLYTSSFGLRGQNEERAIEGQRRLSTQQPGTGPAHDYQNVDPYRLIEDDLKTVHANIRQALLVHTNSDELERISTYYFDGQGKSIRPALTLLMARALNYHLNQSGITAEQIQMAMVAEMIHTASLVHDDVIDQSNFRRGKPSVNALWSQKKVAMTGDFIIAVVSMILANIRHCDVTITISQAISDLVQGEFMQLGAKETENERFAHYLTKTYRKTASLMANSLKSTALLCNADDQLCELAFQYGRNIGLAFQLVDDLLDFVSSSDTMGKPTATDLKLGLATAPVLFACEKYPELNPMIMRRFQEPGDVEKAFELVHKSQGLEQTRFLAKKHCNEALRLANSIAESPYQKGLIIMPDLVINRMK